MVTAPKLPPSPRALPRAPVPWPAPLAASEPRRETPDAPFRDRVPEPAASVAFQSPRIESFALANGVRVLFVERHELPLASVRIVARAGASDLGLRPGEAAFLGALIEQGTKTKSAREVSDAFAAMGATHSSWIDWDAGEITTEALSSQLDRAIDLVADLAENASFPQQEIDRLQARWVAARDAERASSLDASRNAVAAALYGRAHPYGHALDGGVDDLAHVTQGELVRAWRRAFNPAKRDASSSLATSRSEAARREAECGVSAAGGSLTRRRSHRAPPPHARRRSRRGLVLVDRARSALQPQVAHRRSRWACPFGGPDRDALAVMNAILGGMFSSHINLNLREAHAYTAAARGRRSELRRGAGTFHRRGRPILASHTGPPCGELRRELARDRQTTNVSPGATRWPTPRRSSPPPAPPPASRRSAT